MHAAQIIRGKRVGEQRTAQPVGMTKHRGVLHITDARQVRFRFFGRLIFQTAHIRQSDRHVFADEPAHFGRIVAATVGKINKLAALIGIHLIDGPGEGEVDHI